MVVRWVGVRRGGVGLAHGVGGWGGGRAREQEPRKN